jgi:predicted ArsR family transcriptional regulator
MTETEAREMLRRVGQEYLVPPLAEGEFTCQQFADTNEVSYSAAKEAIDRAIRAGAIVTVGRRKVNGRASRAYRLV